MRFWTWIVVAFVLGMFLGFAAGVGAILVLSIAISSAIA
jgi:hypothetical protein